MEWFYADAGQRIGPVTDQEFQALRASGKLRGETLVWKTGMTEWQPLHAIDLPAMTVAAPEGYCSQCGRTFAPADLLTYGNSRVCAGCKDVFFQRLREQGAAVALPSFRRYGGFWIRLLARFLDGLILNVALLPLGLVLGLAMARIIPNAGRGSSVDPKSTGILLFMVGFFYLIVIVVVTIYEAWFISKRGATPGKLVVGLRIIRPNGDRVSFWRAAGRLFAQILSGIIFYIGYIIAAFDEEKRALHDRICDTRVVYK